MRSTSSSQRLCVVVHAAYPVDVRVARQVRAAVRGGYDVEIIALRREGEARTETIDGARVFRLPFSHHHGAGAVRVLWEYVGFALAAASLVALRTLQERYDVVQIHNPPDFLIAAAFLPRLRGARVVFDIHDLAPDMFAMRFERRPGAKLADRLLRTVESWATRVADAVITVHEPYRQELARRGVDSAKVVVVMNSVDPELLPEPCQGRATSAFRIVYHGTITPHYGVHLLVEAAAVIAHDVPHLSIEIFGEGDTLPLIQARARELGLASRLRTTDRFMPHKEVLACVRCGDVGVIPNLPTRLNRYALSSKLLEYVAMRVPVVCADLPTLRSHFTDEEVLFFEAGDADSLAEALLAVAHHPNEAAARAEKAHEHYARAYAWEANARRYLATLGGRSRH